VISLKYPIKLKIEAVELSDGTWEISYEEYFRPEHLEAFKSSYELGKGLGSLKISLDEERSCIDVKLVGSRGNVFDLLCGEFFTLSNLAQKTLQELYILAGIQLSSAYRNTIGGVDAIKETKKRIK